jgi:hypothetical protein
MGSTPLTGWPFSRQRDTIFFVMLIFLDRFFFVFHSCIIVFNLFGWILRRIRLANLIVLSGTLCSWSILGIWYGFGYCPFTEWHWRVRMALGDNDLPSSYIKFLVDTLTGWDVNARLVDTLTVVLLLLSLSASVSTNALSWARKRGKI